MLKVLADLLLECVVPHDVPVDRASVVGPDLRRAATAVAGPVVAGNEAGLEAVEVGTFVECVGTSVHVAVGTSVVVAVGTSIVVAVCTSFGVAVGTHVFVAVGTHVVVAVDTSIVEAVAAVVEAPCTVVAADVGIIEAISGHCQEC